MLVVSGTSKPPVTTPPLFGSGETSADSACSSTRVINNTHRLGRASRNVVRRLADCLKSSALARPRCDAAARKACCLLVRCNAPLNDGSAQGQREIGFCRLTYQVHFRQIPEGDVSSILRWPLTRVGNRAALLKGLQSVNPSLVFPCPLKGN